MTVHVGGPRRPQGHRRTVFGPTIDSLQHELLPALSGGVLDPDREALVRSSVGRLLIQFGDYDAGLAELERAVDQLPPRSVSRAATLLWLGWPYGSRRPVDWHLEHVRRAVDAIPDDLAPGERLMLDRLHATRLLILGSDEGWALVDRVPDRADTQDVALQAVLAHADVAYAALLWGRYDRADEHMRITERLSESWYFEGFSDALQSTRVHLDWHVGRWEGLAERALALTTTGHDRFARLESLLVTSRLSAACGLPERAGTHPEVLLAEVMPHEAPELLAQAATEAGHRRLAGGDSAGAVQVTEEPTAEVLASGNWLAAMEIVPTRVEALVAEGHASDAEDVFTEFEGLLCDSSGDLPAAAISLTRGLLLDDRDPEAAAAELDHAVEAFDRLPRPYDAARVRIRRAQILLRTARRQEAVRELHESRARLATLRAWPHVAHVEAQLARLGVRGRGGIGGRRAYGDELSPRERDVVRLVTEGRTNRQIARELILSPKTVANHVASARRKLSVPSRTALAVAAISSGLIEHPAEHGPG